MITLITHLTAVALGIIIGGAAAVYGVGKSKAAASDEPSEFSHGWDRH